MLEKNIQHSIVDIISYVKNKKNRDDNFCLYGNSYGELKADGIYYVADYPKVDDNGNEIFPQIVQDMDLQLLYYGQQFADVIDSALEQKSSASSEDFINALNYYSKKDTFLDF